MKIIALIAIGIIAGCTAGCTFGVGPDGSYYSTLDAKGAIVVTDHALDMYKTRKAHRVTPDK